jgi:hypothetical protein
MARTFRLSDLSKLISDQKKGLYPHIAPNLTWGRGLITLGALFSPFADSIGVLTSIDKDQLNLNPTVAQASHRSGAELAHFTFFSPESALETPAFNRLIEYLITKLGDRKAHSIVAEVPEDSPLFEALHKENFSVFARQQIWEIKFRPEFEDSDIRCRWLAGLDAINVHRVYNRIVPHLIQSIELGPLNRLRGVVCYRDDGLAGYADVVTGPFGIWTQPFIPLNEPEPQIVLAEILNLLAPRRWRPVYICQRMYQSHLSQLLQDLGVEPGPKQVVMARRLTSAVKKPALSPIPQINGSREATTPYSNPFENKN